MDRGHHTARPTRWRRAPTVHGMDEQNEQQELSDQAWNRIGWAGIISIITAFAAGLLDFPGNEALAPWLFWGGGVAILAAGVTHIRRGRR